MPANPDLPPWMGQQPPPMSPMPPPPPSPPGWGVPPPIPPPLATGFLTFLAIFNLIFSLACGCISGSWASGWNAVQQDPDGQANGWEEAYPKFKSWMSTSDQRTHQSPTERVIVDHLAKPDTVRSVIGAVSKNPSTPVIRTATMAAAFAQAALFLGSILLLMRKNVGRILSMLALATFIGGTVATIINFPGVAQDIGREVGSKITEAEGYRALPPAEQAELTANMDAVPETIEAGVTVTSIVFMAWPAIALLILLASGGIKNACLPYRGP